MSLDAVEANVMDFDQLGHSTPAEGHGSFAARSGVVTRGARLKDALTLGFFSMAYESAVILLQIRSRFSAR